MDHLAQTQAVVSAVERLLHERRADSRPTLVGISGIDASGKSTLARAVGRRLRAAEMSVAEISIDWFHTLASRRFLPMERGHEPPESHGRHFYQNAFRWAELHERLIEPLCRTGGCDAEVGVHDMRTDTVSPRRFVHTAVRVVLLEGIFIFRREDAERLDLRVWIDCPFDLALRHAVERNQEGLTPGLIRADYERVYFPAQRHHIARDRPAENADLVIAAD
ncbi:MAG: uridine kinase [Phycisphaerales bacterium]